MDMRFQWRMEKSAAILTYEVQICDVSRCVAGPDGSPFSMIIALARPRSGNPDFPPHLVGRHEPADHLAKGNPMSKGNNKRGNKEIKKPKQEKPKASATPVAGETKSSLNLVGKKIK